MYRYLPYFKKIKNIIEDKTLGDVSNIISNFNIKVFKEKKFSELNLGNLITQKDYLINLLVEDQF